MSDPRLSRLNDDERDLLARTECFRREVVHPGAAGWERARRMPVEALKEAAARGLTLLETRKEHGGLAVSFTAKMLFLETLARESFGFAFSLINTQNVAARFSLYGTGSQIERFVPPILAAERYAGSALSEPGAGSDFAGISTTAVRVAGGWRLNGEKGWITNAERGDIFVTYAQTDAALGWRGIACFIVDGRREGFARVAPYDLAGSMTAGVGGFVLHDYLVPDADVIAGPGDAFKLAVAGLNQARTYVAGMLNAMVAECLRHAIRYANERQSFGSTLLGHQGLRWKLADVATDLEASRLLADKATLLIDSGGEAQLAAAQAKKFAGEMALARIADCIQVMGARGMRDDIPLARHLLAAKLACYTDGSTEIQNERIGQMLIKEYG